mgnify:FL=1
MVGYLGHDPELSLDTIQNNVLFGSRQDVLPQLNAVVLTDEVLARYRADMTREEGEQAGVQLAKEVIAMTEDFADGYYFSFPFNRVTMLEKILD